MLHNLDLFLVDALLSCQSVSSLQRYSDQPRYVILSQLLELPPKPQSIFHCKRGTHVYRNPGTIPSGISVHMTNPIIVQDVSITLAPRPSTMASQVGLLNSAYFFEWGRICETKIDH